MYNMEGMMKKQQHACNVAAALGHVHKGHSQTISEVVKPKIRIIHIFAPEIIKTDVANFRELVQRLTGKPPTTEEIKKMPIKNRKIESRSNFPLNIRPKVMAKKKLEITSHHHHHGFHHHCSEMIREKIKGEEEIWSGANSGGGFLGGFAELQGFMEQLNEFPLLPTTAMDTYGQSQQIA